MNSKKQFLMAVASYLAHNAADFERERSRRDKIHGGYNTVQKQRDLADLRYAAHACDTVNAFVQQQINAMDKPAPVKFDHRKFNRGETQ